MNTSRQGRGAGSGQLPAIGYHPDDSVENEDSPQRFNHGQTSSRLSFIESRLSHQEQATNTLLDRALRIKKDVIASLDLTHGSWYEEKQARQLLREHIRTITDVVRKLNRDIEYLENQIRERDGTTVGTHTVVKNLEMNQVVGVTDLRGRVVRCDASIARLAADLKSAFDSIRSLSQQMLEQNSRMVESLHILDTQVHEVKASFDKSMAEKTMQQQQITAIMNQNLTELDARNRLVIDDLRHEIQLGRAREQSEREKLEARIVMNFDKVLAHERTRMDKLEQKLEEYMTTVEMKLLRMEEEFVKETEHLRSLHATFESRTKSNLESSINQQNDEIAKIKKESRTGFSTVHETVMDVKQVLEGKLEILDGKMRKEINQLRKMVVLV